MEIKIELNEKEIAEVTGGGNATVDYGPQSGTWPVNIGSAIELTGPYYADSFASGTAYRAAIGWSGLYALNEYPDRTAGYRIRDSRGEDIGWAPRSSFYYK